MHTTRKGKVNVTKTKAYNVIRGILQQLISLDNLSKCMHVQFKDWMSHSFNNMCLHI